MKREYTLIRSNRGTVSLQIKNGEIIVRAPMRFSRSQADRLVKEQEDWIQKHMEKQEKEKTDAARQRKLTGEELDELKREARRLIPQRVSYYARKIGVTYGKITIRAQHTRWGSCSAKGNLNFNCLLMLMPEEVLDGIVVHELCHRKVMNHSEKFYGEVLKAYPEYRKWDRWLKKNGKRFLQMLPDQ